MHALKLFTAPAEEPVTLDEVKHHLRIDRDEDDPLLQASITAARQLAENETRQALITQTWDVLFDEFPVWLQALRIPLSPLQSLVHVKYYDVANVQQTWSSAFYEVDQAAVRARLRPVTGEIWPVTYNRLQAVELRVTVGYGGAAAVPKPIKQWILCALGAMYENRELVQQRGELKLSGWLDGLLDPFRILEASG